VTAAVSGRRFIASEASAALVPSPEEPLGCPSARQCPLNGEYSARCEPPLARHLRDMAGANGVQALDSPPGGETGVGRWKRRPCGRNCGDRCLGFRSEFRSDVARRRRGHHRGLLGCRTALASVGEAESADPRLKGRSAGPVRRDVP
jgi:hypothetical protein